MTTLRAMPLTLHFYQKLGLRKIMDNNQYQKCSPQIIKYVTNHRGGGVAIVFDETLDITTLESSAISDSLEYISCKTTINKQQFILCCVYRPPSSSNQVFLDEK